MNTNQTKELMQHNNATQQRTPTAQVKHNKDMKNEKKVSHIHCMQISCQIPSTHYILRIHKFQHRGEANKKLKTKEVSSKNGL